MGDVEFALYKVKLALDCEIEELQVYAGLLTGPVVEEINAKIEGIRIAQKYLHLVGRDYE